MIANHVSLSLSELDKMIIEHVPPGGNWKNIPDWVPSKRLEQIRQSYLEGKGSRSTYYGRLHPDFPSYTMNTYFNRPGNGCHIHFEQDRTLSQREAARLQSFTDDFIFYGSKTAINNQIGNAVPPLLAYQIAKKLPFKGQYIDLFSGAGGLSLGFKWAGWKPILANDIDRSALITYRNNIHSEVLLGDLRDEEIAKTIIEVSIKAKNENPDLPLFILGGPPCQGFSTAGKKRSIVDERNWLFEAYVSILKNVKPEGFIFENVTGILSMEKGEFFDMVQNELSQTVSNLFVYKLNSVDYAVPQRRKRVIIIGDSTTKINIDPPTPVTHLKDNKTLFTDLPRAISVSDALSDLPSLKANEDGSNKLYLTKSQNLYQKFLRKEITAQEYLEKLSSDF